MVKGKKRIHKTAEVVTKNSDYQCPTAQAAAAAQAAREIAKTMTNMEQQAKYDVKPLFPSLPDEDPVLKLKRLTKVARQMRIEKVIKWLTQAILFTIVYPLLAVFITMGAAGLAALFVDTFWRIFTILRHYH